jgi:hypothetical protein
MVQTLYLVEIDPANIFVGTLRRITVTVHLTQSITQSQDDTAIV